MVAGSVPGDDVGLPGACRARRLWTHRAANGHSDRRTGTARARLYAASVRLCAGERLPAAAPAGGSGTMSPSC